MSKEVTVVEGDDFAKDFEEEGRWINLEKDIAVWLEEQSKHMKIGENYTYSDVVSLMMNYYEKCYQPAAPQPPVSDAVELLIKVRDKLYEFLDDDDLTDEKLERASEGLLPNIADDINGFIHKNKLF